MNIRNELTKNITDVQGLLPYLQLSEEDRGRLEGILTDYPISITPYYLSLIDFSDPEDPIRKMAVPSSEEASLGGSYDTSGEAHNTVLPGLQHKYAQTALMLSTNQCAMYCRHCFRKRLVGTSEDEILRNFGKVHSYITEHKEINNVLVSGGDALLNDNLYLENILSMLSGIEHLDAIRICSRTPVVWPERITGDPALLDLFERYNQKKQLVLATQFNHPRELTEASRQSIRAIQRIGMPILNQAVLLKGVNDDSNILGTLLRQLVASGVMPYYIFQCRPVAGVKNHFQVPIRQAYQIIEEAKAMQTGIGKAFRYCMSHVTGKIEILGIANGDTMYLKYHESIDPEKYGTVFKKTILPTQTWLDQPSG